LSTWAFSRVYAGCCGGGDKTLLLDDRGARVAAIGGSNVNEYPCAALVGGGANGPKL